MSLISFTAKLICAFVTAKLISAVVFAYADCWFSNAAAHIFLQCEIRKKNQNSANMHGASNLFVSLGAIIRGFLLLWFQ